MKNCCYKNSGDAEISCARQCVKNSGTSFAAGMAILPKEKREAMYALYAFCRKVDDIADERGSTEERRKGLQEWREKINLLFQQGKADDDITKSLALALNRFPLAEKDFQEIIDGMEMDAGKPIVAPSLAELDTYCDRVASAVGRASVRIFGDDSQNGIEIAHHLGRALQLTNILRDLAEDAERGRLYLPKELLEKHSIYEREPRAVIGHNNLPFVCRDLAKIAQEHFSKADACMKLCNRKTMRPARIMRAFYGAILEKLIADNWQNVKKRINLSKWQKVWLVAKSFFSFGFFVFLAF